MRKRGTFIGIGLVLGLLLMAFQNMSLVEFNSLNIADVDDASRQEQARELLGSYYRGSHAHQLSGQQYLNYLIYKKLDRSLKAKWKDRVPELVQTLIIDSQEFEFDPVFFLAVMQTESTFNPDAVGTSGEIGLMQILPKTGEWIARKYQIPWRGEETLRDPVMNVRLGIRYFAMLRAQFTRQPHSYVPAYNMGPKNMRRINREMGTIGPDGKVLKREYAVRVMKNYYAIYEQMVAQHKEIERIAKAEEAAKETAARAPAGRRRLFQ